MGKPDKKRRGDKSKTVRSNGRPKRAAFGSVVGQLSPDLISTVFAPELIERATESLENYSERLLEYSELINEQEKSNSENDTTADEVEIEPDGSIINRKAEVPNPPIPPIYHSEFWINEFEEVLRATSEHFQSKNGGWKVHARAAKFERQLDEKYGRLRPFITNHPEVEQFVRSVQRKYAKGHFSPFRQGKAPIPRSAAVILLFMMQRGNLRWDVMVLSALFLLVGLQPWALVAIVAFVTALLDNRRKKPMFPMKSHIEAIEPYYGIYDDDEMSEEDVTKKKIEKLYLPVGSELGTKIPDTSDYDTIILGSGPASLYTAALLSRAGRRVLVLSPRRDASGCFEIEGGQQSTMEKFNSVPFDVESSNVGKISRQQALLAPALCTSTDYQGGIRFAKIGSDADDHAFEILSVPGMGTDRGDKQIPFVLRASGERSLMDDAATFLGDGWPGINGEIGDSACGSYLNACEVMNSSSSQYYLAKLLPDAVNDARSKSTYHETSVRYASSFLDKGFILNAHARSLLAAIGMKGENIKPSMTSMGAHVTNVCASMSGEGMHYPIGGPRALCHALATVVEQCGGRILTGVSFAELLFDEATEAAQVKTEESKESVAPRCIGVKLADKREIKFDLEARKDDPVSPTIVSMLGLVTTFIRLLPESVRLKHKVPRGLPALSERRPVLKALFALNGTAEELNLSGADFYRLPGAALAMDEMDPVTGQIKLGTIGGRHEGDSDEDFVSDDVNTEPTDNPQVPDKTTASKPKHPRKVKFDAGSSWIQVSFPSAKDPTFESRHGKVSTCVVTIEADDDFVTPYDTKPKLYAIHKANSASFDHQRIMERLKKDLLDIYPQLAGKCCTVS